MPASRLMFVFLSAILCGCSSIDGLYAPACTAYEGDEIELLEDRFTWRRFTDQRTLDAQGQVVDPFPDYPKNGSYEHRDPVLILSPDSGNENTGFFLVKDSGVYYLLTGAEHQRYELDGVIPECALRRRAED
ncbi:MAG: hypothetical protein OER91_12640 [Gammaproteobacteria bacterium]|nr:hypothetical protein [Gammaproteobacteria bacterium]